MSEFQEKQKGVPFYETPCTMLQLHLHYTGVGFRPSYTLAVRPATGSSNMNTASKPEVHMNFKDKPGVLTTARRKGVFIVDGSYNNRQRKWKYVMYFVNA